MSLKLVYGDLMSAQDGCLLAITNGEPLPTAYLQQLPPWRAVMLARVADKAGVGLEQGTLAQLVQESARLGGRGMGPMTPKNNAKLTIEVSWPQSLVTHEYHPEIKIIDATSNQAVAVLELSENEWLRLSHGTYISNLDGWLVPEHLRDRLGKKFENTTIPVPHEIRHQYELSPDGNGPRTQPSNEMTEWAQAKVDELNSALQVYRHWTEWKLYHAQAGYELQLRRWLPIPDAEAVKVEA